MKATRRQLLAALEDGGVHSGAELGQALGISRAAVWKHVRALRELGVEVTARPGQGYQLTRHGPPLDSESISARLARGQPLSIEVFDELDSTSSELIRRIGAEPIHGVAVLAEYQTAGRGRRGRHWQSGHGQGLCLSLGWRFDVGPGGLGGLSLALGVAAQQALSAQGVNGIRLKWPNDLVHEDRKLGGILLELKAELDGPTWLVAGIGINVHGGGDGDTRSDLAAFDLDRNDLAAAILENWGRVLSDFPRKGFSNWRSAYEPLDWLAGRPIEAEVGGRRLVGLAEGVTDDGGLRCRVDGRLEVFNGGEVTVRRGDTAA